MKDDYFSQGLKAHMKTVEAMLDDAHLLGRIRSAAEMAAACIRDGGRLLLCGNGGSAADCQHIAAEFTGRFQKERRPLPALSLTTNTSSLTAIANDYGFREVFSRQVEALGKKGDILMGFSTSGSSENVVLAMERARDLGLGTIGFTGGSGAIRLEGVSDCLIAVPTTYTPSIQEAHIIIGHMICGYVDDALFGTGGIVGTGG